MRAASHRRVGVMAASSGRGRAESADRHDASLTLSISRRLAPARATLDPSNPTLPPVPRLYHVSRLRRSLPRICRLHRPSSLDKRRGNDKPRQGPTTGTYTKRGHGPRRIHSRGRCSSIRHVSCESFSRCAHICRPKRLLHVP